MICYTSNHRQNSVFVLILESLQKCQPQRKNTNRFSPCCAISLFFRADVDDIAMIWAQQHSTHPGIAIKTMENFLRLQYNFCNGKWKSKLYSFNMYATIIEDQFRGLSSTKICFRRIFSGGVLYRNKLN